MACRVSMAWLRLPFDTDDHNHRVFERGCYISKRLLVNRVNQPRLPLQQKSHRQDRLRWRYWWYRLIGFWWVSRHQFGQRYAVSKGVASWIGAMADSGGLTLANWLMRLASSLYVCRCHRFPDLRWLAWWHIHFCLVERYSWPIARWWWFYRFRCRYLWQNTRLLMKMTRYRCFVMSLFFTNFMLLAFGGFWLGWTIFLTFAQTLALALAKFVAYFS